MLCSRQFSRAFILLALVAATTALQPGDQPVDYKKVCTALGPYSPMRGVGLKPIETQQFCSTSGLDSNPQKCLLLDATEGALIKGYESQGTACHGEKQTAANAKSPSGVSLPFPLSDQRPLPSSLSSSLWSSEGSSMYWIWKNLFNFNQWAGCAATSTAQTITPGTPGGWLVPAGWTVHSTLWQASGNGKYWPFASVIYKGGDVAILIRGSQTEQDWKTDFDYNTGSTSLQPGSITFPGQVHQGFARVAASLWGGVAAALKDVIGTNGQINNVYVAGHSLGAGVATLISYGTQEYLNQQGQKTKVDALLFAPPNAGDGVFADKFGATVNARRMPFLHDVVPQIPCSPSMVGCPRASVPTGSQKYWSYSPVPGSLVIQPSGMPQQADKWALFGKIYPCQIGKFFTATHVCSYDCYLSQFGGDSNNNCKLWEDSGSGTYCGGKGVFPTTEGRPYPYQGL